MDDDMFHIWNGPNRETLDTEALANLLRTPSAWGNLELSLEAKGTHALVYREQAADGAEAKLLVRIAGKSPRGDDTPVIQRLLDGGAEPFTVASRSLVPGDRAVHVLVHFARTGEAAPDDEREQPLAWGDPTVSTRAWSAIGEVQIEAGLLDDDVLALVYWYRPTLGEDEDEVEAATPPSEEVVVVSPAERRLTDDETTQLPETALWPLVRQLNNVTDPRWLDLIAAYPMPWLQSLMVATPDLARLPDALQSLPRLEELIIHAADATELPVLCSATVRTLVLDVRDASALQRTLDAMSLPALRTLVLFDDALDAPLDLSRLEHQVVVLVDGAPSLRPERLRNVDSALVLSLNPPEAVTPEALVAALEERGERLTYVSSIWSHADEAAALAEERGVTLRVD